MLEIKWFQRRPFKRVVTTTFCLKLSYKAQSHSFSYKKLWRVARVPNGIVPLRSALSSSAA